MWPGWLETKKMFLSSWVIRLQVRQEIQARMALVSPSLLACKFSPCSPHMPQVTLSLIQKWTKQLSGEDSDHLTSWKGTCVLSTLVENKIIFPSDRATRDMWANRDRVPQPRLKVIFLGCGTMPHSPACPESSLLILKINFKLYYKIIDHKRATFLNP